MRAIKVGTSCAFLRLVNAFNPVYRLASAVNFSKAVWFNMIHGFSFYYFPFGVYLVMPRFG